MIAYNIDSKIIQEVLNIMEKNKKIDRLLVGKDTKHFHFNISPPKDDFLGFDEYIVNIQFYTQNRLEAMKRNHKNWITVPGCISCTIINNKNSFFKDKLFSNNSKIPKNLDIKVEFGKTASSSRNKKTEIQTYPTNSHKQLEELEYLFPNSKITLNHTFNPNNELTKITINGKSITVNTPEMTAKIAIDMIIERWFKDEIETNIK